MRGTDPPKTASIRLRFRRKCLNQFCVFKRKDERPKKERDESRVTKKFVRKSDFANDLFVDSHDTAKKTPMKRPRERENKK